MITKPDLCVVAHDVMETPMASTLVTTVKGIELYSQRGMVLLDDQNMVCINGELDACWLRYFSESLKIKNPSIHRVNDKHITANLIKDKNFIGQVKERGRKILLFPFYYSMRVEKLKRRLEENGLEVEVCGVSRDILDVVNSKAEAKEIFMELDIPVPEGRIISRKDLEESFEGVVELLNLYGEVIIKGSMGASGSSILTISSEDEISELERILREDKESCDFLVEKKYRVLSSPNVQIQATHEKEKIVLTDQIMDKDVHKGNIYPPMENEFNEEIVCYCRVLMDYIKKFNKSSYIIAGMDFIITRDGPMAVEINPRINGSMYPEFLRERLGYKAFLSSQVEDLRPFNFNELTEKLGDFMEPKNKSPVVVPIIPGLFGTGKIVYVILGSSREEVIDVKREFEDKLMKYF